MSQKKTPLIIRSVTNQDELLYSVRLALSDLEGIMPEFEPGGDREHPAWQTIEELKSIIVKCGGEL